MNRNLIFVFALLLTVLLWMGFQEPRVMKNPVNNTTGQIEEIKTKTEEQKARQKKRKQVPIKSSMTVQEVNDVKPLDLDGMSYLAVYRLYRKAKLCHRYYAARDSKGDDWQVIDYIDSFWAEKEEKWVMKGHEEIDFVADEKQNESVHAYVDMCELIAKQWSTTEQSKTTLYLPQYALYDLLQVKKTETKKEAKLKKLLNLEKQAQNASQALDSSIRGEDSWTDEQLKEAHNRITALRKTLIKNDDPSDEYALQHNKEVWAQIRVINQQLSDQKAINTANIQMHIDVLEDLLRQAKTEINTHDPDVYLLAMMVSNMNPRITALFSIFDDEVLDRFFWDEKKDQYTSQYVFPIVELMTLWGLKQTQKGLYFLTVKASILFYYCSLGADCGPESPLMYNMCLGLSGVDNKAACGVSAVDYFFDGQLTAGQIHDVEWMLDVMERHYAP